MIDIYKEKGDTWPKVLKYNYQNYGDSYIAMRYKHYGIWQSYTWKDYYINVKYLALGLVSLGLKSEDKVLILGENNPQWYFAELAIQSVHAISVGVYSDLSQEETKYIIQNSNSVFAIVQDQEQVDKLIEIKSEIPQLKKIIYWNYKGLAHYHDALLTGYKEVLQTGKKYDQEHNGSFEKSIESGNPDDICSLIYSSGTTEKRPKGAIHTFQTIRQNSQYHLQIDPWKQNDNVVTYLPPVWMAEQWFSIGCHLLSAAILNFAESSETLQTDIREIGPDILLYEAWLWEREAGKAQARLLGEDAFKKYFFNLFMPTGYKNSELIFKKQKPNLTLKILNSIANLIIFKPIQDSLGLTNARICYATGSMVSPDAFKFYHALNIPLRIVYGTTEGGSLSCHHNDDIRIETVGQVHKGIEIKTLESGEMIFRHKGLFKGYYNDQSRTAEILKEGWLHSGDSGEITDDGHIIFIDRLKDVIKLPNNTKISPQLIESRLRFSPFIKDALVVAGTAKSYVSVIIIIDFFNMGSWANQSGIAYTNFADLSQKPEVYNLVNREINKINNGLSPEGRIHKFINLFREFDPDEAELTRNRKLRRTFIEERYQYLIDAIYSNKTEIPAEADINTADGRIEKIKTNIAIKSVEEVAL